MEECYSEFSGAAQLPVAILLRRVLGGQHLGLRCPQCVIETP